MARGGDPATYIAQQVKAEDRGYKTPCLVWQGAKNEKGYARANVPGYGKRVRVHRVAYEIVFGPIPEGLVTDHLCRVTSCCNPYHLEIVTVAENTARGNRDRVCNGGAGPRTHCARGHDKQGKSTCPTCNQEAGRRWREANREKYNANMRAYMRKRAAQTAAGA